jgi:hypothetical protein
MRLAFWTTDSVLLLFFLGKRIYQPRAADCRRQQQQLLDIERPATQRRQL